MRLEEFYKELHVWVLTRGPKYLAGLLFFFIGLWVIKLLRSRLRQRMAKRHVHSSLQPFLLSLTILPLYLADHIGNEHHRV